MAILFAEPFRVAERRCPILLLLETLQQLSDRILQVAGALKTFQLPVAFRVMCVVNIGF